MLFNHFQEFIKVDSLKAGNGISSRKIEFKEVFEKNEESRGVRKVILRFMD